MADEMVTLASFADATEAHLARNLLVDEGIEALVMDDGTSELWHMGASFGTVKLVVARSDHERAMVILDPEEGAEPAPAPWTCPACNIEVDHKATACPACGKPNTSIKETGKEELVDDEEDEPLPVSDDLAALAWRASIFGLIICPPLLHIYSGWLLVKMALREEKLSSSASRKALGALAIDLIVFVMVVLFFRAITSGP